MLELNMAKGRILVVDDDRLVLQMYMHTLRREGYKYSPFFDAARALRYVTMHHPEIDLALIDLVMPVMSGVELSKRLLVIAPELPVILTTAQPVEEKPTKDNVRAVLPKPTTRAELFSAVQQYIRQPTPSRF